MKDKKVTFLKDYWNSSNRIVRFKRNFLIEYKDSDYNRGTLTVFFSI